MTETKKSIQTIAQWADDVGTYQLLQQLADRINRESLPYLTPEEHEDFASKIFKVMKGYDDKYARLEDNVMGFADEDRCVVCGAVIPEGSHVCISCKRKYEG